ncbi:MAG TPA: nuclear transport factor 2 family protein [Terriglobales bacterium]|nr:nuclear transport factor 2 family protein [Terriglobales bacterium]
MNWRVPLIMMLLTVLTACTMWKEHKVHGWSDATSGEQLERLFWSDLKAKNWGDLDKHLSSGFIYLSSHGTMDRATALEELKRIDITDFSLGDFVTQQNGPDLVVTYTVSAQGTRAGEPLPSAPIHMMTVWQQIPHGWIAIAHSRVPQTQTQSNTATSGR